MDCRIKKGTMKIMYIKNIKGQILIAFLFVNQLLQANDLPPDFNNDVEDVPGASIDQWIFLMVLLGIGMMVYYMKKKQFTEL